MAPAQLAEVFTGMTDSQQAEFFNRVGKITAEWKSPGRFMQFSAMGGKLDADGSQFITELVGHVNEPVFKQEIDVVWPDTDALIEKAVFKAVRDLAAEHGRQVFDVTLIVEAAHTHPTLVRNALYHLHQQGKVVLDCCPPSGELNRIQSAWLSMDVPV